MPSSSDQSPHFLKPILVIGLAVIVGFSFFNLFSSPLKQQLAATASNTPASFSDDYNDLTYVDQASFSNVAWNGTSALNPIFATITSSNPPSGAIDARDSSQSGLKSGLGFKIIYLTFSGPIAGIKANDFLVSSSNPSNPPTVANVLPLSNPSRAVSILSRPLIANERITLTHKPSGSSVCLGFKPLDIDGDGRALSRDLSQLRYLLTIPAGQDRTLWPLHKVDINHDRVFNEADITRALEIAQSTISPIALPACPAPASDGAFAPVSDQAQMANTLSALSSLLQTLRQSLAR